MVLLGALDVREHSGHFVSRPEFPAALLSLIWQSQIDPRYRKMCTTLSFDIRNASLRFCRCHLKPSAARAAHFPLPSVGVPSRVDSQIHLKNSQLSVSNLTLRGDLWNFRLVLRNDMEGAPDRRERGGNALSSRWPQIRKAKS